jgi:hypothetical protein
MRWNGISIGAALVVFATAHAQADPPPPTAAPPPAESPPAPAPAGTSAPAPAGTSAPAPVGTSAEDLEPTEPPPLAPKSLLSTSSLEHVDDWTVGIDADVGPLPGLSAELVRAAVHLRFGYRWTSGHLFAVPEGTLELVEVVEKQAGAWVHSEKAWVGVGGRAGLRFGRLEVAAYMHGYVWFLATYYGGRLALDLGSALSLRLSPSVAVGAHAAYNAVESGLGVQFGTLGGTLGLHVELMR